MWTLLLIVAAAVVAVVTDRYLRVQAPVAPPKSFGLKAFEAHGLTSASGDVLKAVVATISFLGHPFTVVEEARAEKSSAAARSAEARDQVEENLQDIEALKNDNLALSSRAKDAEARASAMDVLVAQVSSVVGK
jgi:hypothetical protein